MSTLLKKKILELNALTPEAFPMRKQHGFQANMTCSYPMDDRVNQLVAEIAGFWKDCEWDDEDVALLSENSIIAIMAACLEMEEKSPLCELGIKWLLMRNAPKTVSACIVQSFYATRIKFNEIYAIRVATWNYITKPDLSAKTILNISKTGKLELNVRNHEEFDGNVVNEHMFLSGEYLKLTRDENNPMEVRFRPMAQYDYTIRREGELAEPISQRAAPLGYNPNKEANPSCFRDYFVPHDEIAEQIEKNKRIPWVQKSVDYMKMADVDDESDSESEESSESETSGDSAVGTCDSSAEERMNFSIQQQAIRVRE